MKKCFAAILFYITAILITHNNISIPIFGVNVNLTQGYGLKIISVILIFLFIFWTIEEIKANNIIHAGRLLFLNYFRDYIKSSKPGANVSNLIEPYDYNQILQNKDLYYIDGTLVLKTTNIFENDKYKPEGCFIKHR